MKMDMIRKQKYLNSKGVAMKLANITVGAWQRDLSIAIATPQSRTVTPTHPTKILYFS